MHDPQSVNVLDSTDDLLEHFAGFFLIHTLFAHNIIEQLSIFHVLHDEKQMLWGFDDFVELDDVWMPYEFEDVHFPRDSLHVGHIHNLILFQNLDCNFLACWDVRGQFDFAERAFPKCLL